MIHHSVIFENSTNIDVTVNWTWNQQKISLSVLFIIRTLILITAATVLLRKRSMRSKQLFLTTYLSLKQ